MAAASITPRADAGDQQRMRQAAGGATVAAHARRLRAAEQTAAHAQILGSVETSRGSCYALAVYEGSLAR
jgi:hypothetical protein